MATLQELRSKIKAVSPEAREKLFYAAVIVLVALLAFGIGRLSVLYGGTGKVRVLTSDEAAASENQSYPPPSL